MSQPEVGSRRSSISVAMCTFNGERFLSEQLQSILRQTDLPDEMVVCDDRSTDTTLLLLEVFAATAPFPVYIHQNPVTLRPAQNFAKCISLCQGNVIVLSDQDDVWAPTRIASTRSAFQHNPSLTFTFSDAPLINSEGQDLGRSIYSSLPVMARDRRTLLQGVSLQSVILRYGVIYGATMAFRASLLEELLPIPQDWSHDEWIALVASTLGPSQRLDPPVMYYRQHDAQQVGTGDWTALTHLQSAKQRGESFYLNEVRRIGEGIKAAAKHSTLRETLVPKLQDVRLFLQQRRSIHSRNVGAFFNIFVMFASGRYGRYSAGVRSCAKDLIMFFRLGR